MNFNQIFKIYLYKKIDRSIFTVLFNYDIKCIFNDRLKYREML